MAIKEWPYWRTSLCYNVDLLKSFQGIKKAKYMFTGIELVSQDIPKHLAFGDILPVPADNKNGGEHR